MPDFNDILKILPDKTREILNPLWDALPVDEKETLKEKFEGLPLDLNLVNMLIDQIGRAHV